MLLSGEVGDSGTELSATAAGTAWVLEAWEALIGEAEVGNTGGGVLLLGVFLGTNSWAPLLRVLDPTGGGASTLAFLLVGGTYDGAVALRFEGMNSTASFRRDPDIFDIKMGSVDGSLWACWSFLY